VKRTRSRKGRKAPVKPAPVKADNVAGASAGGFEMLELRQLIRLVQRTGIGELEVSSGGRSVRISAMPSAQGSWVSAPASERPATEPGSAAAGAPGNAAVAAAPPSNLKPITSPMVGTFYRAPAPDADPFVEPGDVVEAGQTVCVIEAMKLMNEIEAEFRGKVVQVLVENAQPVEFGQKLFLVDQT
jgi:oxaloacetate decarboxylase alpha subunit